MIVLQIVYLDADTERSLTASLWDTASSFKLQKILMKLASFIFPVSDCLW